jgi:dipeptidyl aminopeptidase/acylaminoacyl peptidase
VQTKESGAAEFAVADNGTLVYVPGAYHETLRRLVWLHADGTSSALPIEARVYGDARLSPDGRRIAATVQEHGIESIWIYDTTRDSFTRVTPQDESVSGPVWSPDGQRVAFWSESQRGLFTIAADGSDRSDRLVGDETGTLYPSAWSPDGRRIAFVQERPRLTLLSVSTQPPHSVQPLAAGMGAHVEGAFSPDGRWLAHIAVAFDGAAPEVVIGHADAAGRQWPIAPTGRYPTWTADGHAVMYVDNGVIYRVMIDTATGMPVGRPTKLVDLPASMAGNRPIQLARDGRGFLMLEPVIAGGRPGELRLVLNWGGDVRAHMAGAASLSTTP